MWVIQQNRNSAFDAQVNELQAIKICQQSEVARRLNGKQSKDVQLSKRPQKSKAIKSILWIYIKRILTWWVQSISLTHALIANALQHIRLRSYKPSLGSEQSRQAQQTKVGVGNVVPTKNRESDMEGPAQIQAGSWYRDHIVIRILQKSPLLACPLGQGVFTAHVLLTMYDIEN